MPARQVRLSIDELHLDAANLRVGLSESDSLLALFGFNEAHLRNLVRSIAEEGLDPGDSFYVVASPRGGYIVLDGNRRLAALRVLIDPSVLDGEPVTAATRRALGALSSGFDRSVVEPLSCVQFPDREAAAPWIRRRHTGEMNGEGRVQWNTLGVQRASGIDTTIDVIDFVARNAGFSREKRQRFEAALAKGKATTFRRLVESARGQAFLGISTERVDSRTTPFVAADVNRVLRVLIRIVDDLLAGKADTRTLHSNKQIDDYFSELPAEMHPSEGELAAHTRRPFKEVDLAGPSPKSTLRAKPPVQKKPARRPRTKLAPSGHEFDTSTATKFAALVREAEHLSILRYPLASAFLLRTAVALAVNKYMRDHGLLTAAKGHEYSLEQKARAVAQHIVDSKRLRRPALQAFRTRLLGPDSPCSIQSLNGFVHDERALPTANDLRVAWDAAIPLFIVVHGEA